MSRKKKKHAGRDPLSDTHRARAAAESPAPQFSTARWVALLSVAVGSAAIVIGAVVRLTPVEDAPPASSAGVPPARESVNALADAELVLPRERSETDVVQLHEELAELADSLVKEFPDQPTALLAAGLAFSELQQSERAVEVLRRCVDLGAPSPDAYVGLAENLTLLGKNQDTVQVLQEAVERQQVNASVTEALAEALALVGQSQRSAEVLQRGVQDHPQDADLWLRLGQTQLELQRFERAEESIRRAMQCGIRSTPAWLALSSSLARQGKMEEAAQARRELARQQAELKQQEQAGFQHQFEAKTRTGAIQTLCAAAKTYLEQNRLAAAQEVSLRAIALDPQQVPAHLLLIEACRRQNRWPDVLVVLQRLIELQPDRVAHYTNMAKVAAGMGDYELAERVWRQAVELQAGERGAN